MFIIDNILLSPVSGIFWIFRKVHEAALEEMRAERETLSSDLRELHMGFEMGEITVDEFDVREKYLLDRLDAIEEQNCGAGAG